MPFRPRAPTARGRPAGQAGQASVELVALLPVLVALAVAGWQLAVAGQAIWLSGTAARAAARAEAVGGDAAQAARAALPPRLREGLRVHDAGAGHGVVVRLRIPAVVGHGGLATVRARAQFADQTGAAGATGPAADPGRTDQHEPGRPDEAGRAAGADQTGQP